MNGTTSGFGRTGQIGIRRVSEGAFTKMLAGSLGVSLILAASSARATEPAVKIVTIEGRAAGADGNAMEQAKQDALRRAVEQTCGTFINAQSKTKEYQLVYDKVMSLAVGYVTEFDVLERRTADGISYCKVKAKVSTADFETEWARVAHTIEAEGNPRCVVVVVEDNDTDDGAPAKTNSVSQSVLENFFLSKGVQLMDKTASDDVRTRDIELAALNNDVNKLAAAAAGFKADVVIRGVADARRAGSSEIAGKTIYRWKATLNVRAYHTDSAQMLMSNTYMATKTTTNANAGGDEALQQCATENAGKVLKDIAESWRKRQNVRRISQISLENCTYKDFQEFQKALSAVEGVQAVKMRELVNNVADIEVDWSFDLQLLVSRITELKVPDTVYDVGEMTHDRVKLKIVKAPSGG